MFVPSLSWQNDGIFSIKTDKKYRFLTSVVALLEPIETLQSVVEAATGMVIATRPPMK
jgi:hypothetical protein|eukprot:COSAG06_NODE_4894_length_3877_cov_2.416623_2_plen_58_part_00